MIEPRLRVAALRYDHPKDRAPKLVARGEGHVAGRILALAREHGIPVHDDRELVGALARSRSGGGRPGRGLPGGWPKSWRSSIGPTSPPDQPRSARYNPRVPRGMPREGAVLAVVWQFDVQVGSEEEFEKLHGADGAWTALSRRSRSFLGSSFLKDLATPGRYLLLEYWSEMMVYEKHLADFSDTVDELKAQRTAMVKETVALGVFDALDVPERYGPTWSVRDGR